MNRRLSVNFLRTTVIWSAVGGLLLALGWSSPAGAGSTDDGLQRALDRILADQRLAGAVAGVTVNEAETGRTVYAHHSDSRLMPASNTKLITSAAAMDLLGPDHRYHTDVLTDGSRRGPWLRGNLYLRGTGDPTVLAEDYDRLAAEIAASGIRRVTGALVADDTRFDRRRLGRSWAADNESYYYSAQISPLTVAPDTDYDAGTVYIEAVPGAKPGDAPEVTLTPDTDYLDMAVQGTTVAAGKRDTLAIEREHGSNTVVISGQIPIGASATRSWTSVWEPTGYAAAVFADALAEHGVHLARGIRTGRATPPGARRLARHTSMPLRELLIPFMKLSNNNHAEVLTKTIGYRTAGSGSWDAGLAAVGQFLRGQGVDTDTVRQVDGSGLSRMNIIPSDQFVELLTSVRAEPWFDTWYDALPVACKPDRLVGGTLRSRMCDTPAAGNAHAKTGSLTGASALSGYVTDADGRELVFSVVLNNYLAGSVKDIEDAVVTTLAAYGTDHSGEAVPPSSGRSSGPPPADVECSWIKPRHC